MVLRFGFILGMAVTLLQLAYQLVFFTIDDIQIVICQLAPLLLGFTFNLQPFTFDHIVIHYKLISLVVYLMSGESL